jgi:hypothetical protein
MRILSTSYFSAIDIGGTILSEATPRLKLIFENLSVLVGEFVGQQDKVIKPVRFPLVILQSAVIISLMLSRFTRSSDQILNEVWRSAYRADRFKAFLDTIFTHGHRDPPNVESSVLSISVPELHRVGNMALPSHIPY